MSVLANHRKKYVIAAAQALVSIALLAWIATRVDLAESLGSLARVPLGVLVTASALMGLALLAAALRWSATLHNFAIRLSAARVSSYYFMGLFLSMFLPTSVGGDAFRIYVVARASGKAAASAFATMQERAIGLCGAIAVSLAVMPFVGGVLPLELRAPLLAAQVAALFAAIFAIYPPAVPATLGPVMRVLQRLGRALPRLHSDEMAARIEKVTAAVADLLRTRPANVATLIVLAVVPSIAVAFGYREVLGSMGVSAPVSLLMLIIPLVWLVRMLPISLGGIGLGEGAFVVLAAYAGIDRDRAFAAALTMLAIQIAWSLVGGALLLRKGLKSFAQFRGA